MASRRPLIIFTGDIRQLQDGDLLLDHNDRPVGDYLTFTNAEASALSLGDICYYSGAGGVKKAKADAAATIVQLCFCTPTSLASFGGGLFQFYGGLSVPSAPFVAGNYYYLSPTTAGALTTTVPSTAGQYIIRVGYAYSTAYLFIDIQPSILLS